MRKKSLKSVRLSSNMPALAFIGILAGEAVEFSSPLFVDKIVGADVNQFQEADRLWLRSFHCWLAFNYGC